MRSVGVTLVLGLCSAAAAGDVVLDPSWFAPGNSTHIDFETDGNGTPIIVSDGGAVLMDADAFDAHGIWIETDGFVGLPFFHNPTGNYEAAQSIGGSLDNAVQSSLSQINIGFSTPIKSFGFWFAGPADQPMQVVALDAGHGTVTNIWLYDEALGGTIGDVRYGYIGFTSEALISEVMVFAGIGMIDNLSFSTQNVPAPPTGILLGAALLARRRSRSAN